MGVRKAICVYLGISLAALQLFNAFSYPPRVFASVNNYYVATTGSDSSDGSQAHPWKTISHASSALSLGSSGTTVHVAGGTYNECVTTNRTGTATQRIRYVSDTALAAKIVCNGVHVWTNGTGSNTRTADYVDIVGFEITASPTTSACEGISQFGAFTLMKGNYVHDILGQNSTTCGTQGGGGIVFRNNGNPPTVAHDSVADSNIIDNIGKGDDGVVGDTCATLHGIYMASPRQAATNNLISRACGWGVHMFHDTYQDVVAGNVVVNNYRGGILTSASDGFTNNSTTVIDNIVANNGGVGGGSTVKEYGIEERWGPTGSSNVYRNNILWGNQPGNYNFANGSRTTSGNLCGASGAGCNSVVTANNSNVVNSYTGSSKTSDLTLKTGSPAIGAGATGSCASGGISPCVPSADFLGLALNSPPDIGAYAHGASAASATCLSTTGMTFLPQTVGSTSSPQTASITNCGTATLSSIAVGNSNTTDFGLTYTGPSSLSAGATSSNTISVVSHPSTGGGNSGTISVTSNAATKTIALSGSGNVLATAPNPPTSLNVSSLTASTINLAWTASSTTSPAITNYKVYRGTSSGGETLPATVGNVTSYADTTVSVGNTYYYRATALNANGESAFSNEISQAVSRTLSQSALLVSFGVIAPLSSSSPQTITLTKTGTVNVAVTSVTSSSSEFTVSSNTCGTLSSTCTFDLTFSPTVSGAESAIITIVDDASGNPHHITVVGGIAVGATIFIPGVVRIQ